MKNIALAFILIGLLVSCETDTKTDAENTEGNNTDTTVVIYEDDNTTGNDNTGNDDNTDEGDNTEAKIDYKPLMNEYHQILCKKKNNTATVDDDIRLAELTKQLNDIRKTLSDDEKFTFTADMAKAATTEDC